MIAALRLFERHQLLEWWGDSSYSTIRLSMALQIVAWSSGRLPLFAHQRCTQCPFKALPWETPCSGSMRNEIDHVCNHTEEAVTLLLCGKMSKLHDALYLPQIWQYAILPVGSFLLLSTRLSFWVILSRITPVGPSWCRITPWSYFVMLQMKMSSWMVIIHGFWTTISSIHNWKTSWLIWYQRVSVGISCG